MKAGLSPRVTVSLTTPSWRRALPVMYWALWFARPASPALRTRTVSPPLSVRRVTPDFTRRTTRRSVSRASWVSLTSMWIQRHRVPFAQLAQQQPWQRPLAQLQRPVRSAEKGQQTLTATLQRPASPVLQATTLELASCSARPVSRKFISNPPLLVIHLHFPDRLLVVTEGVRPQAAHHFL